MTGNRTKGICTYCGGAFTRVGMARHLRACRERQARLAGAGATPVSTFLHLQVSDAYSGRYWLHLEMAGSARLDALDEYLRAIWLECCSHLSGFTVGDPWRGREVPFGAPAGQALRLGRELTHVYDFGTSTETTIKVVDERSGAGTTSRPIALMARNEPPEFSCMECDEPATRICTQCVYEEDLDGALCDAHAEEHPHEDYDEPLPVVNSPRMGVYGYTGPAEPPY